MRTASVVLSAALVLIGFAIVIRTVAAGVGGGLGLLVGALFIAAGCARLYLVRRH